LLVDDAAQAVSCSIFHECVTGSHLTASATLTSGRKLTYILEPRASCNVGWVLLCDLFSGARKLARESVRGSQRISLARSIHLKEGFFLIFADSGHLLAKKRYFAELMTAKSGDSVERLARPLDFTSFQSLIEWFSLFAARYAAITVVQIAFGAPLPSPYNVIIDPGHAGIMFTKLETPKPELPLIRLGGQFSSPCSRDVLLGSMRTALVSAGQAIALAKNEIGLFVQRA
jgi:hypothetical protein